MLIKDIDHNSNDRNAQEQYIIEAIDSCNLPTENSAALKAAIDGFFACDPDDIEAAKTYHELAALVILLDNIPNALTEKAERVIITLILYAMGETQISDSKLNVLLEDFYEFAGWVSENKLITQRAIAKHSNIAMLITDMDLNKSSLLLKVANEVLNCIDVGMPQVREKNSKLVASLKQHKAELAETKDALKLANERLEAANAANKKSDDTIAELSKKHLQKTNQANALVTKVKEGAAAFKKANEETQRRITSLQADLAKTLAEKSELATQLATLQQKATAVLATNKEAKEQINILNAKIKTLTETELATSNAALKKAQAQVDTLSAMVKELESLLVEGHETRVREATILAGAPSPDTLEGWKTLAIRWQGIAQGLLKPDERAREDVTAIIDAKFRYLKQLKAEIANLQITNTQLTEQLNEANSKLAQASITDKELEQAKATIAELTERFKISIDTNAQLLAYIKQHEAATRAETDLTHARLTTVGTNLKSLIAKLNEQSETIAIANGKLIAAEAEKKSTAQTIATLNYRERELNSTIAMFQDMISSISKELAHSKNIVAGLEAKLKAAYEEQKYPTRAQVYSAGTRHMQFSYSGHNVSQAAIAAYRAAGSSVSLDSAIAATTPLPQGPRPQLASSSSIATSPRMHGALAPMPTPTVSERAVSALTTATAPQSSPPYGSTIDYTRQESSFSPVEEAGRGSNGFRPSSPSR
jgi:site-specific DNA-cytosine methylase